METRLLYTLFILALIIWESFGFPTATVTNTTSYPMELKLVHRDKLSSNSFQDHRHRFHARMQRDVKRVENLLCRLSVNGDAPPNSFGSYVFSGEDRKIGEYLVRIEVGSPRRSQYMIIDSGSDLLWIQCRPCNNCSDSIFDSADSTSYFDVPCDSFFCKNMIKNLRCHAGKCRYEVNYVDGSYTKGSVALETITFGRTVIQNVAIGCGHMNQGRFITASGLLGLGRGSMSLLSQLGGQIGGVFIYCLVSRGTGSLIFGRGEIPVGASWAPILYSQRFPSYYYIGLSSLGVGGIQVPIPEDIFQLTGSGYGGVIMDTGTAVTRLPHSAYNAFRDAYIAETSNLPRALGESLFDTCYNLSSLT